MLRCNAKLSTAAQGRPASRPRWTPPGLSAAGATMAALHTYRIPKFAHIITAPHPPLYPYRGNRVPEKKF